MFILFIFNDDDEVVGYDLWTQNKKYRRNIIHLVSLYCIPFWDFFYGKKHDNLRKTRLILKITALWKLLEYFFRKIIWPSDFFSEIVHNLAKSYQASLWAATRGDVPIYQQLSCGFLKEICLFT